MDKTKLKLSDLKVLFFSPVPKDDFGASITFEVKPEYKELIEKFVKENNVGKNTDPSKKGVAKFREYEGVTQFSIKLSWDRKTESDKTLYGGLNGLSKKDIGYGAVIDLIANAYEYEKGGGGIGISVSAIVVKSAGKNGSQSDLDELFNGLAGSESTSEEVPF